MSDLKLSGAAAEAYFEEQRARVVRYSKPHQWTSPKRAKWLTYCDECGLVWSNNRLTQKAVNQGCTFYRLKEKT